MNSTGVHGCFPVNLLHIFRKVFPKSSSGWLLLKISPYEYTRKAIQFFQLLHFLKVLSVTSTVFYRQT